MYEHEYEETVNYKGIDDVSAKDLFDRWLNLETLCDEHVRYAHVAAAKLERLIEEFGEDTANEAVYAMLGSDDARMLLDDYERDRTKGYVDMNHGWYRPMVAENLSYIPRHYSPDECYEEFRDAVLFEVFKFEHHRPECKEALDAFLVSFCGGTFEELFGLED